MFTAGSWPRSSGEGRLPHAVRADPSIPLLEHYSIVVTMKTDASTIAAALRRHRRSSLFHWSPTSAVPSVLEHGLLPRRELDARGIAYAPHGYGRVGKEVDFAGHVVASFMPQWGMMRGESGPMAIFEIDAAIASIEGAFYCPENTARNDYEFTEVSTWTTATHLDDLFVGPADWEVVSYQAEIWVPEIPVGYIKTVHFRSEGDRDEVLEKVGHIAASLPGKLYFAVTPSKFPEPQPLGNPSDELPF
jgi:hypothetical protein